MTDINERQLEHLRLIKPGPKTNRHMADTTGLTMDQIDASFRRMENRGWVRRTYPHADGIIHWELTNLGRRNFAWEEAGILNIRKSVKPPSSNG